MQLRHEYKHPITPWDAILITQRLEKLLRPDPHASLYHIRSVYFDTPSDRLLREKEDGLSRREKFRIRMYNGDDSFIRLEKKIKLADLGTKISAPLTRREAEMLLAGETDFLLTREENVLRELYAAMRYESLKPKTIVDYTRRAFVYPAGNVRVTIDRDIRTGLYENNLFAKSITVPAANEIILEVKYDNFLPDFIRECVQLGHASASAFSKYAACRAFEHS